MAQICLDTSSSLAIVPLLLAISLDTGDLSMIISIPSFQVSTNLLRTEAREWMKILIIFGDAFREELPQPLRRMLWLPLAYTVSN